MRNLLISRGLVCDSTQSTLAEETTSERSRVISPLFLLPLLLLPSSHFLPSLLLLSVSSSPCPLFLPPFFSPYISPYIYLSVVKLQISPLQFRLIRSKFYTLSLIADIQRTNLIQSLYRANDIELQISCKSCLALTTANSNSIDCV